MSYKKTIVLSSTNGGNEKGVLNIELNSGEMKGQLKLYNFSEEPNGVLSLGIKEKEDIIKAGLTKIDYMKYGFNLPPKEMENFSCGLINIFKGEANAILHGSTYGTKIEDSNLLNAVLKIDDVKTVEECKKILDDNGIDYENREEIEKQIDKEINCQDLDKCSGCKYRYAFFTQENEVKEDDNFYDSIKEDVEKLFNTNEEEEFLMKIIPSSKWVKVENESGDNYYVLGLIYDNDKVKYICYGVPAIYDKKPPKELGDYAEWLPLDSTDDKGYGYYITYQDADSGNNVKANFTVV